MALILSTLIEILNKPVMANIIFELAAFVAPIWIATLVGLLLGWAWRPRRAVEIPAKVDSFITHLPIFSKDAELENSVDFRSSDVESDELAVTAKGFSGPHFLRPPYWDFRRFLVTTTP